MGIESNDMQAGSVEGAAIGTASLLHSDQLATAGMSLLVFNGMFAGLSQPLPSHLPHCRIATSLRLGS